MTEEINFATQINKERIEVKCFNCNKTTIMICDPLNLEFNNTYTVLCDECLNSEYQQKQENKMLRLVSMVVNTEKEMC